MTDEYEKEIFSQDLALSVKDIEKVIEDFYSKAIDAYGIKWERETVGIKQILVVYRDNIYSPENKVLIGYYEINPLKTQFDKPVHLKIVSFKSELAGWWLNLAQVIQSIAITPGFSPSLITSISRELLAKIPVSSLPEIENKPEKPARPEEPAKRSGLDIWFKYFDECKEGGWKITLKEVAHLSEYSYGYIRGAYSSYKREQGD